MAENVLRLARNMLEWMSDEVASSFDPQQRHPLALRHVHVFHAASDLLASPGPDRRPWVVLATHGSLELGPARDLLTQWADHPANRVVFTGRAAAGTLGAKLQRFKERPLVAPVTVPVRRPLGGVDLAAWAAAKCAAASWRAAASSRACAARSSAHSAAAEAPCKRCSASAFSTSSSAAASA